MIDKEKSIPYFEIDNRLLDGETLHIVDRVECRGYGTPSILGISTRDDFDHHGKDKNYYVLRELLQRLISNDWDVKIQTEGRNVFHRSSNSRAFTSSAEIRSSDVSRSYLDCMDLTIADGALILSTRDSRHNVESDISIDLRSITEITAELKPLNLRSVASPVLGKIKILKEGDSNFVVSMAVLDSRVLNNIAKYDADSWYVRDKPPILTMNGYFGASSSKNSWNKFVVINSVNGLALAVHLSPGRIDKRFAKDLSRIMHNGLKETYVFDIRGNDIQLTDYDDVVSAVESLKSSETHFKEQEKKS